MGKELILMENVESLGKIGDVVKVADGYARNYLLPQGLGEPLTKDALKRIDARKQQLEKEYRENRTAAESLAERIGKASITIAVEANEQEKMYGSISEQQVVDALAENELEIQRDNVMFNEPIRELGVFTINIKLMEDIQTTLKLWVVRAS